MDSISTYIKQKDKWIWFFSVQLSDNVNISVFGVQQLSQQGFDKQKMRLREK
jgi:hypothetical protein